MYSFVAQNKTKEEERSIILPAMGPSFIQQLAHSWA
jgi:hypothetical protein